MPSSGLGMGDTQCCHHQQKGLAGAEEEGPQALAPCCRAAPTQMSQHLGPGVTQTWFEGGWARSAQGQVTSPLGASGYSSVKQGESVRPLVTHSFRNSPWPPLCPALGWLVPGTVVI